MIYKICFIIACFFALAGVAWAGLNYESAYNYFLIDQNLKIDHNLSVGNTFGSIPNSFAISRNLLFANPGDSTPFVSGNRQMNKNSLITNAISINSSKDFEISAIEGSLIFQSTSGTSDMVLSINKDLVINNGLTFTLQVVNPLNNTIYVNRVLTNEIALLNNKTQFELASGKQLLIDNTSGSSAYISSLKVGDKDFCELKIWNYLENVGNSLRNVWAPDNGLEIDPNEACTDTHEKVLYSKRACCDQGYLVYNLDVSRGEMICCKFNPTKQILPQ